MRNRMTLSGRLREAALGLLLLGLLVARPCLGAGPPPVITVQPLSQSVLFQGSVTFQVVATSGTTMTYQWYKNGFSISGATLGSYTIANAQATDQATYTVKVTNGGGSVTSSGAMLTVLLPPAITTQPQSQTVAAGRNAALSVVVSGTPPFSYQWSFNGAPLSGATNSSLTLGNVQTNDGGSYTVTVTNLFGALNSSAAKLRVLTGWIGVVVNANDSGAGSLRQALLDADANPGPRSILFNIPGASPFTINVVSPLPVIAQPVLLDATTQPGFSNRPVVEVNGKGSTGDGLYITAGGCTIQGLAVNRFPGCGIVLASGSSNVIQGNFIGTGSDGTTKLPNSIHGLMISNSAWNIIGGNDGLTRNVILTSGRDGIHLEGTGANCNQVLGNFVGMDWTGLVRVGVKGSGIVVSNAAWNVIGGTNAGAGNISSWNWGDGLVIKGSNACFNQVQGNLIGTDISGTRGAGNSGNGITIQGAPSNTVGGLTLAAANVIVNHSLNGIAISDLTAQYNVVQGNFIGTDLTGTLNLKNGSAGVSATSTCNNTVGGLTPGAGNTIAFNGAGGVLVSGGQCAILGNNLFSNTGDEIRLLSGGNTNAAAPELTGVTNNLKVTWIQGRFTNTPATSFWVEFFSSPTSVGDGKTFLGGASVGTDAAGQARVNTVLTTGNITNQFVTATATDASGNTSPLSLAKAVAFNGAILNDPPVITSNPQSLVVISHQDASFSVAAAGTGPFTYQWNKGNRAISGATSATLGLTSVTAADAADYTVVVTQPGGSVTSAVATLTVLLLPEVTAQPLSQVVTAGESATFSVTAKGTAPLSYQWSLNGTPLAGATSSTLTLTRVQATEAGSYAVVVANAAGSVTSEAATLTVIVPPTITTQPRSQTVKLEQSVTFSVEASGTAPLSYQWSRNGTPLSGATSSTLTLESVQTNNAGSYAVVVANAAGLVTSEAAALTVNLPPEITTQPQSQVVTAGQNATLTVTATGTDPLSYQWSLNGTNLADATSSTLTLNNVQTNDTGSYTVVVTNVAGSITSAVATLTVNVPPGITTQPQSQVVTAGQNATFTVTATGTDPLSYQWSLNGTVLSGATRSTLALNNVQTTDAGSYTVVVTNVAGTVTSAVAMLTVTNSAPTAPPSLDAAGMTSKGFEFTLPVPTGSTYVIFASTNLQDWTPIYTNVALTGSVVLTDPAATNCSRRFYRAMVQ